MGQQMARECGLSRRGSTAHQDVQAVLNKLPQCFGQIGLCLFRNRFQLLCPNVGQRNCLALKVGGLIVANVGLPKQPDGDCSPLLNGRRNHDLHPQWSPPQLDFAGHQRVFLGDLGLCIANHGGAEVDCISRIHCLVTTFHGSGPTSFDPHPTVRVDGQLNDVVIGQPVFEGCEVALKVGRWEGFCIQFGVSGFVRSAFAASRLWLERESRSFLTSATRNPGR